MGVNIETIVISDAMNCKNLHISTMKKKTSHYITEGVGGEGEGDAPQEFLCIYTLPYTQ